MKLSFAEYICWVIALGIIALCGYALYKIYKTYKEGYQTTDKYVYISDSVIPGSSQYFIDAKFKTLYFTPVPGISGTNPDPVLLCTIITSNSIVD